MIAQALGDWQRVLQLSLLWIVRQLPVLAPTGVLAVYGVGMDYRRWLAVGGVAAVVVGGSVAWAWFRARRPSRRG